MVQPIPAIETKGRCGHCDSNLIVEDEDGKYCLLCRRPYDDHSYYGRIGGLQTFKSHGSSHMAEIGKRGGRPRLRQPPAPKAQSNRNGGSQLPNRLDELKELYAVKYKRGASLSGS